MRRLLASIALAAALTGCGHGTDPVGVATRTGAAKAAATDSARPAYPAPRFSANDADVYYDMDTFEAMERLVGQATRSIRLDYYIFAGPTAQRLADLLIAKHQAGLSVHVLLDAKLGTIPELTAQAKPVLAKLRAAGVPVAFHSRLPLVTPDRGDTIDHNKYFVVDEQEVLVGSMNLAKKFYAFHDLMIRLQGPVATDFAAQFDHDWWYATHPDAKAATPLVHAAPAELAAPGPGEAGQARLVGTGIGRKTGLEAALQLIGAARASIHIQMHELGDGPVLDALIAARDRGVEVKILLDPGNVDPFVPVIHKAPKGVVSAIALDKLLKAHMDVKHFRVDAQTTTAHMKIGVFDGQSLLAGSINWTPGGFEFVSETDVEIHGGRAPVQAESQFQHDWVQRAIPAEPPSALALALCKVYLGR
jgi:cardiolipin synthase